MGIDTDILLSAVTRARTLANSPPISWPGVNFDPPNAGIWLEMTHFPNQSINLSWDSDSANEFFGFIQILVLDRPGKGIVNITAQAELIIDHFPKGLLMGGVRVQKRPYIAPAVKDGNRLFIPITIPYRGIN